MNTGAGFRTIRQARFILLMAGLTIIAGPPAAMRSQDEKMAEEKALLQSMRQALQGNKVDRQLAALSLIPEIGKRGSDRTDPGRWVPRTGQDDPFQRMLAAQAGEVAGQVENFLKTAGSDEGKVLGLKAYGKLAPTPENAAAILRRYLKEDSADVRQAAGSALVDLAAMSSDMLGTPLFGLSGISDGAGLAAGGAAAFLVVRTQVEAVLGRDKSIDQFNERTTRLLPVCALALNDPDDRIKSLGADAVLRIAQAVRGVIPDSATLYGDTRPEPFEMKLKWFLLAPTLAALNEAAPNLVPAMTAQTEETRMMGARAASLVLQARAGANVNQKIPAPQLALILDRPVPPDDALRSSMHVLLPALAARLEDPSESVRLVAIEGFETAGPDGLSQLGAVLRATEDCRLFIRWVAARALGRLLPDSKEPETDVILRALVARLRDSDLDVRGAAMTSLSRGKELSRPTTEALIAFAIRPQGDPEQRSQAIITLEKIKASPSLTVPGLMPIFAERETHVRTEMVKYLGRVGRPARAAIPELRKLLQHPDEELRKEAAKAILSIERDLEL